MCQLGELLKDSAALPVSHPKELVSINGMTSDSGSLPVERQHPLTGHGLSNSSSLLEGWFWWTLYSSLPVLEGWQAVVEILNSSVSLSIRQAVSVVT